MAEEINRKISIVDQVSSRFAAMMLGAALIAVGTSGCSNVHDDDVGKDKMSLFRENASDVAAGKGIRTKSKEASRIGGMLDTLAMSPTAERLLRDGSSKHLKASFDSTLDGFGYYSPSDTMVYVNPSALSSGKAYSTVAHEMTHSRQESLDAYYSKGMSLEDAIFFNRITEADASSNAVQVTWELKEKGITKPWEAMVESDYGDMAKAFARSVKKDSASAHNGVARKAAFDRWFAESWRRNQYDAGMIEYYNAVLKQTPRVAITESKEHKDPMPAIIRMGNADNSTHNYIVSISLNHDIGSDYYKGNISPKNQSAIAQYNHSLDSTKTVMPVQNNRKKDSSRS